MIEESTLKSNFIGRDGFRWWIGQIAQTASAPEQANGEGWAFRYKVRILGYHPDNYSELSDEDLPWAGVMMPTTAGSGGGGFAQSARINQGDIVVGFFPYLVGFLVVNPWLTATLAKAYDTLSEQYERIYKES